MVDPLIEIKPSQVTPALKALFDRKMPTAIRCYAVLGGGNAGRIFVDDLQHPQLGYVWERDDGTLYHGGRMDGEVLRQLRVWLRWGPRKPADAALMP